MSLDKGSRPCDARAADSKQADELAGNEAKLNEAYRTMHFQCVLAVRQLCRMSRVNIHGIPIFGV